MPKRKKNNKQREASTQLSHRNLSISIRMDGMPATIDEGTRSVEVVGATENPVAVFDWTRGAVVQEVLLMSGAQLPQSQQIPLLDAHERGATKDIIGSYRAIKTDAGQMIGRAYFSEVEEAQGPYQKVKEGHLTDFSIGYRVDESIYISEGQQQTIQGTTYDGPLSVVTFWTPRELSACPIGADDQAKARAATAPTTQQNKKQEDRVMDEKIRKFLEGRGLSVSATEDEAYRFLETLDVPADVAPAQRTINTVVNTDAPAPDIEQVRADAVRNEQTRILEIRSMCAHSNQADMADDLISKNKTVDEARKAVFDKFISSVSTAGGAGFRASVTVVADERDKFRAAAEDSILLRAGVEIAAPATGATDLRGYSLRELARESLRIGNHKTTGSAMEMVGRALTTSDFPALLANVANKSLFDGFTAAEETWPVWVDEGSVSDFKTHTSARASETDDLDEIREEDEYRYGSRDDAKEEYKITTYGKLFKISRQAIINDDLSALSDTPASHGEAASRKVGDIVYAVLTANSVMGDNVALFHATHKNLGTAGVINETTIAEAIKLMKLQQGLKAKRRLNIRAQFFIAPVSIEGNAEIFFNSGMFAGANAAATRTNPYAGTRFVRVYDARLDDDSLTAYYLAGRLGRTVRVFFLGGNKTPYLETKQGWNVDGVEYKVRIDAGAKAMDWKALVKNAGV